MWHGELGLDGMGFSPKPASGQPESADIGSGSDVPDVPEALERHYFPGGRGGEPDPNPSQQVAAQEESLRLRPAAQEGPVTKLGRKTMNVILGRGGLAPEMHKLSLEQRIERNTQRIENLGREVSGVTVVFLASKSSAKTTTAVHTGLLAARDSGRRTVIIDGNPEGRAVERFGLGNADYLNIKQVGNLALQADYDAIDNIGTTMKNEKNAGRTDLEAAEEIHLSQRVADRTGTGRLDMMMLNDRIAFGPKGVRVIGSSREMNDQDARRALDASRGFFEFRFIDTGNVIEAPHMWEFFDEADVFVMLANAEIKDSLPMLTKNMNDLRGLGLGDHVDRSIVVISNLGKYDRFAEDPPHKGVLLGVPHDKKVASDENYNLEELRPRTLEAYQQILIAILEERKRQLATSRNRFR